MGIEYKILFIISTSMKLQQKTLQRYFGGCSTLTYRLLRIIGFFLPLMWAEIYDDVSTLITCEYWQPYQKPRSLLEYIQP